MSFQTLTLERLSFMAVGRAQERTSIPFSRIGVSRKQRICLEAALPITTFDTRNRFDLKSNQIKSNQINQI